MLGVLPRVLLVPCWEMMGCSFCCHCGNILLVCFLTRQERESIVSMGLDMIDWSLETGWDSEFGGIYYFLDADGHSPEQLVRGGGVAGV